MRKILAIAWLLAIVTFCLAATNTPWDGTEWDSDSPDIDQPLGNAYKELYSIRRGVEIRINYEHLDFAASSVGGVHAQGAAVAYHQDAIPTLDGDGEEFTTAANAGHLHIDTNHAFADKMFFLDTADGAGSNVWTGIYISLEAELVADTHQWADVQTFDVQTVHTLGLLANGAVTLGAGDDLVGSATSAINMNNFDVDEAGVATLGTSLDIAGTIAVVGTLDDDTMGTATATTVATSESIKAYIDAQIAALVFPTVSSGTSDSNFETSIGTLEIKSGKHTLVGQDDSITFVGAGLSAFTTQCLNVIVCGGHTVDKSSSYASSAISKDGFTGRGPSGAVIRFYAVGY